MATRNKPEYVCEMIRTGTYGLADVQHTYIAPDPYLSRKLCTTLASFKKVKSAMSSTRSNFGGFIFERAYSGSLRIYSREGID
jgi:hypothetical protein